VTNNLLANRYLLRRMLGQGNFGAVYEAQQINLERTVAIKLLHRHLVQDQSIVARFLREGKAASRLKHKSAVQIYDCGDDDGVLWLAMEFLEGETLEKHLSKGTYISPAESIKIIGELCDALHDAHKHGVIHRDLKPQNIMLEATERGFSPKILDFGFASCLDDTLLTKSGITGGSPPYMSPEQWRGLKYADPRSDIYALGLIAYQLLSGKRPFEADNLPDWFYLHRNEPPPDPNSIANSRPVHPRLVRVLFKALEKIPDARYQTALELREALSASGQ
jgi:serine/threonine protein kinase